MTPSIRPIFAGARITDNASALEWIRALVTADMDFHFEDKLEDIIDGRTGERFLSPEEIPVVGGLVSACFEHLEDPFVPLLDAIRERTILCRRHGPRFYVQPREAPGEKYYVFDSFDHYPPVGCWHLAEAHAVAHACEPCDDLPEVTR